VAIELLNYNHFDVEVRNFAVKCLDRHMRNEDVQSYLLQLVQAIKNESFYENALSKFLLRRAFQSQRLGWDLYWSLK
jgi:phosphatidylinositol-4,5-bisphosphate 3-kinase